MVFAVTLTVETLGYVVLFSLVVNEEILEQWARPVQLVPGFARQIQFEWMRKPVPMRMVQDEDGEAR